MSGFGLYRKWFTHPVFSLSKAAQYLGKNLCKANKQLHIIHTAPYIIHKKTVLPVALYSQFLQGFMVLMCIFQTNHTRPCITLLQSNMWRCPLTKPWEEFGKISTLCLCFCLCKIQATYLPWEPPTYTYCLSQITWIWMA